MSRGSCLVAQGDSRIYRASTIDLGRNHQGLGNRLITPAERRISGSGARLSLEDLRLEPTIYLLPEYDTEEEARGYLREYCSEIFEEQLDGWYRVPSAWPVDRTFDTFNRSFEYSFHSVLVDLSDEPVMAMTRHEIRPAWCRRPAATSFRTIEYFWTSRGLSPWNKHRPGLRLSSPVHGTRESQWQLALSLGRLSNN